MNKNRILIIVLALIFMTEQVFSQKETTSSHVLTLKQFYELVNAFHPLSKQSRLLVDQAKTLQLAAKGNFDPKIFYQFNDKYFNDKRYFRLNNGGISVPTKYGVEFKAGYENNNGYLLNPENNTPANGILYAQISLPLIQGIMTDERRTILKQAQINIKASQAELDWQLNELFYKAGKSYLEWQLSFNNLKVLEEAYNLGKIRFEAMKKSFLMGDRPAIDTVEAGIQVLDRLVAMQQADLEFKNKSILLSGFLWLENNLPATLDSAVIPDNNNMAFDVSDFIDQKSFSEITALHPNIRAANFKLEILYAEKKLKMEKLKPMVNLNYNPLFDAGKSFNTYFNNYKWGLSLNFPILLRKERGELMSTKIKIQQSQFELDYKKNEISNKIRISKNEIQNAYNQLMTYRTNLKNYEELWKAEKRLFDGGESSLFMVNSRENNYINAQLKLNDFNFKYHKSIQELAYSKGQLQNL